MNHLTPHTLTLPKARVTLLVDAFFGFGLSLVIRVQTEVVLSLLCLQDWGLMLVMAGGAGVAMLTFKVISRSRRRPLLGGEFLNQLFRWSRQAQIGSAILGVGLRSVCLGPALAALGTGKTEVCGLWAASPWGLWRSA